MTQLHISCRKLLYHTHKIQHFPIARLWCFTEIKMTWFTTITTCNKECLLDSSKDKRHVKHYWETSQKRTKRLQFHPGTQLIDPLQAAVDCCSVIARNQISGELQTKSSPSPLSCNTVVLALERECPYCIGTRVPLLSRFRCRAQ